MLAASTIYPLVFGLLGALVGSFLNVVIFRLPRDELSVFRPARSFCPSCSRQIVWYENIPIVSWLVLGAKCRGCSAAIPARYVIVEAITALLFGYWTVRFFSQPTLGWQDYVVFASGLFIISVCIAVTYIDIDFKIIPDEITWPGMGLGLLLSGICPRLHEGSWLYLRLAGDAQWDVRAASMVSSVSGLLAGLAVVWAVGFFGAMVFRKEAMGLGDVKYMGMMGAFLGLDGVLLVFFLGCFLGAFGGLIQRWITGDRYIAFGPYLSLGVLFVLLWRAEMVDFLWVQWPLLVRRAMGLEV